MKTALTQDHITAIITKYFEEQGASINFMHYDVDRDGALRGCIVQHTSSIDLPEVEE